MESEINRTPETDCFLGRRPLMEATRVEARKLADEGIIHITQKGKVVDHSQPLKGPIRLSLR